jgi:hypothetical protein
MKFYISERITVIAAFAMALFVQGAEQPNMDWRGQAREAWRVGSKRELTPDATRQIQEYLVPQRKIKISNGALSGKYRIIFENLSSGQPIDFVPRLQVDVATFDWSNAQAYEVPLNVFIVPMKVTVKELTAKDQEWNEPSVLGSVTITAEKMARIRSLFFFPRGVIFYYLGGDDEFVEYEK